MPAVDTTAVNAHNAAVTAFSQAMYRPLRRPGGGANDPLIVAAVTAANAAVAATAAATVNATQATTLALQTKKYSRMSRMLTSPLGVNRRQAMRQLRNASRALATLHGVNV